MSRKLRALLLAFALLVPAADAVRIATATQPHETIAGKTSKPPRGTTLWT